MGLKDKFDEEGQPYREREDGSIEYLVGSVGPVVDDKRNRRLELESRMKVLEDIATEIRLEMKGIDEWIARNNRG